MKEKIAVIVSTYNGSRFVIEQLESIVHQTRVVDKIYVFDDRSSDNTVDIVNRYLLDVEIPSEVIINKINKGWKRNFFEALEYVQEDLIFLADQDDIWMNNKVEVMTNIMMEDNHIDVLTSNYELFFSEKSTNEKKSEEKRLVKDGKLDQVEQKAETFYVRQPGCSFLVRKIFFEKYKMLWNEDMPHDSFLWKTALLVGSLYSINQPLFRWRRHSSNESNRSKITKSNRLKEVASNYKYMCQASYLFKGSFFYKAYDFCELRKEMFEKNSVLCWLRIYMKYHGFYVSTRSCLGDLYLLLEF